MMQLAKEMVRSAATQGMVWSLTVALLLGLSPTALVAAEPAAGPSGFSAATESANSKDNTGDSADCPIKKTVGDKTFYFQNDPALNKPQGGH